MNNHSNRSEERIIVLEDRMTVGPPETLRSVEFGNDVIDSPGDFPEKPTKLSYDRILDNSSS